MSLLTTYISLEKCLSSIFLLLNQVFTHCWVGRSLFLFWIYDLVNIFSFCELPFLFYWYVLFAFFKWRLSVLLVCSALSRKTIDRSLWSVTVFLLRVLFIVLALMFRFLIYFESFLCMVRGKKKFNFWFICIRISVLLAAPFVEKTVLSHWMVLMFCKKKFAFILWRFISGSSLVLLLLKCH